MKQIDHNLHLKKFSDSNQSFQMANSRKQHAERSWERLMSSGEKDPKILGAAMNLCNIAEKALLDEEARLRDHEIGKMEVDPNSLENRALDEKRKFFIRLVRELNLLAKQ